MTRKRDYWAKRFFVSGFESFKAGRWYFLAAAVLFVLAGIIAFFFPEGFVFLNPFLRGIVNEIDGMNGYQIAWFIFSNNITASFTALISGIVFGILPIFNIVFNGVVLGYVISLAHSADATIADIILNLAPHGIFELPAICFSVGLGMRIGIGFIKEYFSFYRRSKKMKMVGTIVIIFAIIASAILSFVVFSNYDAVSSRSGEIASAVTISEIAILVPLVFLFIFSNVKLLKEQRRGFVRRFIGSIKAFFVIVVPLLIVAAIIEAILIVSGF